MGLAMAAGNIAKVWATQKGCASSLSELSMMSLNILFQVRSFRLLMQVTSERLTLLRFSDIVLWRRLLLCE